MWLRVERFWIPGYEFRVAGCGLSLLFKWAPDI